MNIADLDLPAPNTITLRIPAAVVLGLVKDTLPIDAAVVSAHYDAGTNSVELVVQSDFFKDRR